MSGFVLIVALMTGDVVVPMPDAFTCLEAALQVKTEFNANAECELRGTPPTIIRPHPHPQRY